MLKNYLNNNLIATLLGGVLVLVYILLLLKTAWLSDDAYITFRTVDNFINGFGLRWNIAERVQSFTHPLWFFLLSGIYFITREIYYTSIIISIFISAITVYILAFKVTHSFQNMLIILVAIIFSNVFIDYSTSGLENPLTHFLLVLYGWVYFKKESGKEKIFLLSLLSSLLMVNRMDCALLVLPALFFELIKSRNYKFFLTAITGFLPFLIWEIFSLFYYGFPFPNTAYAKLNTGIERQALIAQGMIYFYTSFKLDPLTIFVIICTVVLSTFRQNRRFIPLSIGVVLYLMYIIWVGGDFMSGRFFAAPFVVILIVLSMVIINSNRILAISLATIITAGLLSPVSTVIGDKGLRSGRLIDENGICDERVFYARYTSLLLTLKGDNLTNFSWVNMGDSVRAINSKFERATNIGFFGFYAGRDCHILDEFALSDPLLARLPAKSDWRIGHFQRDVPAGYEETLITGRNEIENKNLAEYYDNLVFIIQGNLWDPQRLKTIWKMNTKQYDYLIDRYLSLMRFNR